MVAICNGMERAGSTYQYNLTRLLIRETRSGEAHPHTGSHTITWPLDQMRAWAADDGYHIVKLHHVHELIPEAISTGRVRVLYIYRDVRDVAASLKRVRSLRGDKLVARIQDIVNIYSELAAIRDRAPENFVWQRYEDAMGDPSETLRQIASVLGLEPNEGVVEMILGETSVDVSKARCELAHKVMRDDFDRIRREDPRRAADLLRKVQRDDIVYQYPEYLLQHNHISQEKGAPGGWRKALSNEEASAISTRNADWLEAAGYPA